MVEVIEVFFALGIETPADHWRAYGGEQQASPNTCGRPENSTQQSSGQLFK